jgi:5-(carboxyamino)imidazole ribonucleotide synthase
MSNVILPPATIGIVGGGQLGRMMALAAKPMGYRVVVLDPMPQSPAGQVADEQIIAPYNDRAALQHLAHTADVATYEFENVDRDGLASILDQVAIPQGLELLAITSNRLREKTFIRDNGVLVTNFAQVTTADSLDNALEDIGYPAILKTVSGGYDGHGQWDIDSPKDVQALQRQWPGQADSVFILEKRLQFNREISIMVTRDAQGNVHTWPVSENVHANHILKTSYAPAQLSEQLNQQVHDLAEKIANGLSLRGVLGIELFVAEDTVYVNELAPRPHNSGHYTIEGTNISQFEGHIRSIVGLPIPEIVQPQPALMMNLLGNELQQARDDWAQQTDWHLHDYGKASMKRDRKMGHITVVGEHAITRLQEWGQAHGQD